MKGMKRLMTVNKVRMAVKMKEKREIQAFEF